MKLDELRKEPHLSASSIGLYLDCSLAYRFRYVDRLKSESVSGAMVFGSPIHAVMEDFYNSLMIGTTTKQTPWSISGKPSGNRKQVIGKISTGKVK